MAVVAPHAFTNLSTFASTKYSYCKQYLAPVRLYLQVRPSSPAATGSWDEKLAFEKEREYPFPQQSPPRRTSLWIAIITAFSILYLFFQHFPAVPVDVPPPVVPSYIYVAVPTTSEPDAELCKTIVSAQVLSYPIPNLIPYGRSEKNDTLPAAEQPLSKISSVHSWLSSLPAQADDGIVLLLDDPSTWFQLRPHVLLERYFRSNERADAQLPNELRATAHQTILFPTQSECAAKQDSTAMACRASTASLSSWKRSPPRYLGEGAIIGPVKAIRSLMDRAIAKMKATPTASPAAIFDHIFSEQQEYRERVRGGYAPQATDPVLEFGIGLDYEGALGYSTVNGEDPVQWGPLRSPAADIAASMPPFWTVSGAEPDLPHNTEWSELHFLSAKGSDVVPAMIHHQSGKFGQLRQEWWPRVWYTQHLRALYTAAERFPAGIVATVVDQRGRNRVFWNSAPIVEKAGAWIHGDKYTEFTALCSADSVSEEVFRDGMGTWKDADYGQKLGDLFA